MAVDASHHDIDKMSKFLQDTGAVEISIVESDDDH
jgi:hypothetical protein